KQSKDDSAKEELGIAEKELNVNDRLISCWKCKNLLKVCIKHERGHLGSKGSETRASFYEEGLKILKDRHWETNFSTPTEVDPTNGTFCHMCGISGPISQRYDECQLINILRSGSLKAATYFKVEILRRHLLLGLLASIGEYYRDQKAYVEEQK
nr:hypothetical protein [Tanacetum cinerariifolium]